MAGLASIFKLRDNALKIKEGVQGGLWCKEIVEKEEARICDMNSEEQLYEKGQNALGVDIMDYLPYRPLTIRIKTEKGQPTDRVTLRDTGDFHGSFFVEANNEGFRIDAKDWKRDELVQKYGMQIFGLNDENMNELAHQVMLPELINKVKETLWQ